jgi:hypothetical protein
MTPPFRSPAPSVGRFTALVLTLVVLVCVSMIGATGYLKFEMDRAETLLAAPDTAVGNDQDMFDRLRRILGYGGFLGLAQNYASHHDASGFADMKADIKSADDIVAHLPEKTPAEVRHDLTAIVASFDTALQKINAPANEQNEFVSADLMPLYAAVPVLDERVASANAETRLAAQNQMQFWGMLLTLVSWASLIIASACAAGIYLTLRDKQSAPMRALAQSIQNMARGDMRTAIWGTERQDMIGELARAVDTARYHFSHLPDLSLLSEQGPVRMRFEGGSRSLFEAMMKAISRDSENIREQTLSLSDAVKQQRESIAMLSDKVETVLQNILQHGHNGDQQIRHAISEMVGGAESLKNAHAHAADQLNRLVPHIQERATGMAEIAQITGRQVAQTLQTLTLNEMNMKASAETAKETLARLSSTADDLGERLFGAINLLQASGKILAETTENIQLHGGTAPAKDYGATLAPILSSEALAPLAEQLTGITAQLNDMQNQLTENASVLAANAANADEIVIVGPADISNSEVAMQNSAGLQALADKAETLRVGQTSFQAALTQIQTKLESLGVSIQQQATLALGAGEAANDKYDMALLSGFAQLLAERVDPKFVALEEKNDRKFIDLAAEISQHASGIIDQNTNLSLHAREAVAALSDRITSLTSLLPIELRQGLQSDWQKLGTQLDSVQANLERHSDQQKRDIVDHHSFLSTQAREAIIELGDKIATIPATLPGEVRQGLKEDWQCLVGQIATIQSDIEKQADRQKRDIIEHNSGLSLQARESVMALGDRIAALLGTGGVEGAIADMSAKLSSVAAALPVEVKTQIAGIGSGFKNYLDMVSTELNSRIEDIGTGMKIQLDNVNLGLKGQMENVGTKVEQIFTEKLAPELAVTTSQARAHMMEMNDKLIELAQTLPQNVQQRLQEDMGRLTNRIDLLQDDVQETIAAQMRPIAEQASAATMQARNTMNDLTGKLVGLARTLPNELRNQIQEESATLKDQIDGVRTGFEQQIARNITPEFAVIENAIIQQMRSVMDQTQASAIHIRNHMIELSDKISGVAQSLPQNVQQQLQEDVNRLSAQIGSAHTAVGQNLTSSAQIQTHIADLVGKMDMSRGEIAILGTSIEATRQLAQDTQEELAKPTPPMTYILPPELQQQMHDHWYQMAAQIEASRASVDRLFTEQVASKIDAFEQALVATRKMVETVRQEFMTPPKAVFTLPPELQQQMHDHWYQVAAQIEASRASLVETISHQVDKMESRLGNSGGLRAGSLSKTASDYATQRQIEQQTQILSELVATLGVLDAHMQQIKTEMHEGVGGRA